MGTGINLEVGLGKQNILMIVHIRICSLMAGGLSAHLSGSGLSTLACSQMIGSTPAETKSASGCTFVEIAAKTTQAGVPVLTCWCGLQQLLELGRGELCACGRHDHSNLCELGFDIGLLQITEEGGGGDPFGRAIRRTFHQINNHLSPTKRQNDN